MKKQILTLAIMAAAITTGLGFNQAAISAEAEAAKAVPDQNHTAIRRSMHIKIPESASAKAYCRFAESALSEKAKLILMPKTVP